MQSPMLCSHSGKKWVVYQIPPSFQFTAIRLKRKQFEPEKERGPVNLSLYHKTMEKNASYL